MALIKHANAQALTRDAIVLDLGDLQRQASALMTEAKTRAAAIAAQAQAERERILAGAAEAGRTEGFEAGRKAGYEAGLTEGREAALAEFKDRLAGLATGWESALQTFEAERDGMLRSAQRDVLRLALLIAERITKRAIATDPQVAVAQLEAVLGVIVRPTELVVRINPEDREAINAALPALTARFSQARHVELRDDPALMRGSCIAETRTPGAAGAAALSPGEIDASIDTQIDRIVEALLPGAGRAASSGERPADPAPGDGGEP